MDSDDQSSNFRIHQISGHGDYPHAAVATDSELCSEIGKYVLHLFIVYEVNNCPVHWCPKSVGKVCKHWISCIA